MRPSSAAAAPVSRDALANAADYGYCASHSRYFWGFRLHALLRFGRHTQSARFDLAKDRREARVPADSSRAVERQPGQMLILIGDKNFRGKDFEDRARRPRRHDHAPPPQRRARPRPAPRADPPTHRVDLLDLQRHPHARASRRPHPREPPRPARSPASPHSPPPSHSTTASAAHAAPSPTTPPETRGTTHLGVRRHASSLYKRDRPAGEWIAGRSFTPGGMETGPSSAAMPTDFRTWTKLFDTPRKTPLLQGKRHWTASRTVRAGRPRRRPAPTLGEPVRLGLPRARRARASAPAGGCSGAPSASSAGSRVKSSRSVSSIRGVYSAAAGW